MINRLRYTLLGDGSSDQALLPVVTWLLRSIEIAQVIEPVWADLRRAPERPRTLHQRLQLDLDLYPCDLLFIHRDAENQDYRRRMDEIDVAVGRYTEPKQRATLCLCCSRSDAGGVVVV